MGAALFVRAPSNAADVDFGLRPDRIAVATKKLDAEGFSPEEGLQYIRDLQAFGRAPPGTERESTGNRAFQVVGISKDGKYIDFDDPPMACFWTSIFQDYAARIVVAAKGTISAEAMIPVPSGGAPVGPLAAGGVSL